MVKARWRLAHAQTDSRVFLTAEWNTPTDLRVCPRFHVFYASLHDKVLTIIVNNEHCQAINIRRGKSHVCVRACACARVCLFACVRVCVSTCVALVWRANTIFTKHLFSGSLFLVTHLFSRSLFLVTHLFSRSLFLVTHLFSRSLFLVTHFHAYQENKTAIR